MLAGGLALFWLVAATQSESHHKDLFHQWALARLAWEGGAAPYDADRVEALADQWVSRDDIETRSPFRRAVGAGPYPPTLALLYVPLGLCPLPVAGALLAVLNVGLGLAIAGLTARLSRGRVSAAEAVVGLMLFPAFYYNLALGQNAMIVTALLLGGWVAIGSGRPVLGGALWGLLGFKLQWVIALLWVPWALRKPRAYVGIAIGSAALWGGTALAFGPDVIASWIPVARYVSRWYEQAPMQMGMAFDLRAASLRFLPGGAVIGWLLIAIVMGFGLWLGRRGRSDVGLMVVAVLTSPHAMYYDLLVAWPPLFVLASTSGRRWPWISLAGLYVALPLMSEWPPRHSFSGPPWATLVLLGTLVALGVGAAGARVTRDS